MILHTLGKTSSSSLQTKYIKLWLMDTVAKSDIFFMIASIASIVLGLLASIFLLYAIRAAKMANNLMADVGARYKFAVSAARILIKKIIK